MRRFLASAWFPLLMCVVLGAVTAAAFAVLKPVGTGINNSQLLMAMKIAGWAVGPMTALLSCIVICILNVLRRLFRLRKVSILHPLIMLLGIGPWLVFSWVVMDEPRYTQFAIGSMDFVGRPLLWGSLVATLLTIALSLPLLFSKKK